MIIFIEAFHLRSISVFVCATPFYISATISMVK